MTKLKKKESPELDKRRVPAQSTWKVFFGQERQLRKRKMYEHDAWDMGKSKEGYQSKGL